MATNMDPSLVPMDPSLLTGEPMVEIEVVDPE